MNNYLFIVIILILVVSSAFIIKYLIKNKPEIQNYPYEKKSLFTPAERSFLGVLEQTVNGQYRIMGKVRLSDIVKVKGSMNKSSWQNAFNRIQSKHVDFVACDPATLNIQFIIELDDSTHNRSDRQERDQFIDNALKAAGIPIFHITAKKSYSVQDIPNIISKSGF
jgi:hypothetical protein